MNAKKSIDKYVRTMATILKLHILWSGGTLPASMHLLTVLSAQ